MTDSNLPISEQWRRARMIWAQREAAASLLEDSKTAVFSQMVLKTDAPSNARAEHEVRASSEWKLYLEQMARARERANEASVECDYLKMRFWEWQSESADRRTEIKL